MDNWLDGRNLKLSGSALLYDSRTSHDDSRLARIDSGTKHWNSVSGLRRPGGIEDLSRAWKWIQERQVARSSTRRLKVAETVSLGEKRFVAVVEVDGLQFLLGGGATNVTLLAQLNATETFGEVLKETMNPPKKQTVKRMRKRTAQRTAEQTGEQA
jgi:hypothetical protein